MSSNKRAKSKLIELYGPECFIEKLHLRKDKTPRRYTSKSQRKRMKQLTYHHIKEKRNGGQATVENGALLSNENHQWFNQQPPEVQAELNKKFQEYKECGIVFVDEIEDMSNLEVTTIEIVPKNRELELKPLDVYDNMTDNEIEEYKQHKQERNKRVFEKFERD